MASLVTVGMKTDKTDIGSTTEISLPEIHNELARDHYLLCVIRNRETKAFFHLNGDTFIRHSH